MSKATIAALSLALAAAAAGAQTIYRCGSSYGDEPCPGAATVAPARAPSAQEAAASRRQAERDMKRANEMEAARLREEARPVAAYIPREKVERLEARKPEVFTAKMPADPKKAHPKTAKKKPAKSPKPA